MATLFEAARSAGISFRREVEPVQRELHTGELTLRYLDWGNENAPVVVLIHGFAQTAHSWDFTSLALSGRYRVLSLDVRGHGDSDWSPDGDYTPDAHQRDADAFLRHIGPSPVTVIGLSMGGGIAYTLAARRPEQVRALVIVDTGPVGETSGRNRIRNFVQLPDELDSFEQFVERVHAYMPHRPVQQIRDTLGYNIRVRPDGKWTWKYDRVLRDPQRPRARMTLEQAWNYLHSIQCPTLLVRGANSDVLARSTAEEMAAVIRCCTLAEVEKSGHLVPGDNPSGFLKVVQPWLDQVHGGFS